MQFLKNKVYPNMASTQSQMLSLEQMTFCWYCVPSVGIIETLTTKVEELEISYSEKSH